MRSRTISKLFYNNLDLTCCISKSSPNFFPISDAHTQTDFLGKQDNFRKQDSSSETNTFDEEDIYPNVLVEKNKSILGKTS